MFVCWDAMGIKKKENQAQLKETLVHSQQLLLHKLKSFVIKSNVAQTTNSTFFSVFVLPLKNEHLSFESAAFAHKGIFFHSRVDINTYKMCRVVCGVQCFTRKCTENNSTMFIVSLGWYTYTFNIV